MRENSRSPNLAEVIRMAVKENQATIHTGLPGRIDKYDNVEQKADICLLLRRPLVTADGVELEPEDLPILMDVPIEFPRGGAGSGDFMLTWPLAPGDLCKVDFIERSMDQWLDKNGEVTTPLDFRMHSLSDAVARPGLYPRKLALKEAHALNAVFGRDEGMQLHITPDDVAKFMKGGVADVSVAIAEALKSFWDTQVKPKFDAFDAHTHTHAPGPGAPIPTGPPVPLVTLPSYDDAITADNLKLKGN